MYRILADGQLFCSSKIEELAVINPVIDMEVNKAGTFKFIVPPTHPYYDNIERKMTLIDVYRDDETEPLFEGICASVEVDFFKQKSITCEGELTFLNDSTLRPSHKVGLTSRHLLEAYINEHNSLVEAQKRFTVGQVTARDTNDYITCFTNYQSTMTEIKEDLVDDIGGFLRTRHVNGVRYLDYLAESPRTSNQVIRLGENLLDLVQSIDTEDLATVIIPLGATLDTQTIEGLDERLTIKTAPTDSMHPSGKDYVYSSDAVNSFGWIEKVVEWDDVTTVSALVEKGKKYLQETQWENLVITASAIDLGLTSDEFNKFRLLDTIRVVSTPHGLDRYFMLSKITINLNNPENDSITLGIEQANKTLSAKSKSVNEQILRDIEQKPSSNQMRAAIDNATALLTGAEGGYVVIERNAQGQPIEIKIQDALNNPTKIWRWNQNGFGYSNDGGQTYGLAMTMDGSIVASYITSGTMTADRIRGGELIAGGSGLGANGQITIKDSLNRNIITINTYGMTLYDENGQGKAWLDHDGLTISGGTIRASDIYAANIYGAYISSECIIDTPKLRIDAQGSLYGQGDLTMDGGANISGRVHVGAFEAHGGATFWGDLVVHGSKSRIVKTEKYGWLAFDAYETPLPHFGDIGESATDDEGNCRVDIDPMFLSAVKGKYHVFIQPYGDAQLSVSRYEKYFVVTGTPNTEFSYEIKAVQKDNDIRFKEVKITEETEGDVEYGQD